MTVGSAAEKKQVVAGTPSHVLNAFSSAKMNLGEYLELDGFAMSEWLKGMVDLHGKELTVLFERFSHHSSPRIERSDGNTLRVAEISDGKIGLLVMLDQS